MRKNKNAENILFNMDFWNSWKQFKLFNYYLF